MDYCFICNTILNSPVNFQDHIAKIQHEEEKVENLIFRNNMEENFWFVFHEVLENKGLAEIESNIDFFLDF